MIPLLCAAASLVEVPLQVMVGLATALLLRVSGPLLDAARWGIRPGLLLLVLLVLPGCARPVLRCEGPGYVAAVSGETRR